MALLIWEALYKLSFGRFARSPLRKCYEVSDIKAGASLHREYLIKDGTYLAITCAGIWKRHISCLKTSE
jgi:hypothetical protein